MSVIRGNFRQLYSNCRTQSRMANHSSITRFILSIIFIYFVVVAVVTTSPLNLVSLSFLFFPSVF